MKVIKRKLLGKAAGFIRNVAENADAVNYFTTNGFYKPGKPVKNHSKGFTHNRA